MNSRSNRSPYDFSVPFGDPPGWRHPQGPARTPHARAGTGHHQVLRHRLVESWSLELCHTRQTSTLTLALLFMCNPTDMPNSERWLFWEDYFVHIFTRMDRGLISAHMCSYQCWLASWVNDPETRCYFPEQGRRDPRVRQQLMSWAVMQ